MAGERPVEIPVGLDTKPVIEALNHIMDRLRTVGGSFGQEVKQAALAPFMNQLSDFARGFGTMIGEANIPLGAQQFASRMNSYMSAKEQTQQVFEYGGTVQQAKAYYDQIRPIEEMKQRNRAAIGAAISGEEQKDTGAAMLEWLIKVGEKMDTIIGHIEWIKNQIGGV